MNDTDEHLMTVFTAALDCGSAEDRAAYLDRACAGDPRLRERVEALLRAHARSGNFLGVAPERTVAFESAPKPGTSNPAYREEIRQLLRSRLILVHMLLLGYMVLLTVLSLAVPHGDEETLTRPDKGVWWHLWPPLAESLIGMLVLWRCRGITLRSLRGWELVCFATHAAFNGYDRFLGLAHLGGAGERLANVAIGIAGMASLQGFITLILAYGVLIPNTRWRTLAAVAGLAAVPLAVIPLAALVNPLLQQGHVFPLALQCLVLLLFPSAIAIFAAARASALQRRAFEAERRANQIGQYTLRRKLGEGGMGEVWLAEHGYLKRPCAVKFVRPELAENAATTARFAREVQAVTGLNHFNTVRVYDHGRADDGSFYLVMEYLDGPTLEALVRDAGPLSPGRAIYLLRQLCGALAEAHAVGLVHRDLKPGNIIIASLGGQHDVAKLLDFGLVQDLSVEADVRLTRTGMLLGTPAYMSPEQAMGDTAVDPRGDIYSLGAVAFFMLTARPPFQGKSLGEVLSAHRSDLPPSLSDHQRDIPPDLAAVVARCLAKERGERFQSAIELDRALAKCSSSNDWSAEHAARWWAERAQQNSR
jgi:serine/threonine-protein kinase